MAQVDVELMDAAWQAAYRRGEVKSPVPGQDDERDDDAEAGSLEQAKLRNELARARLTELKADALEKKLVPVAEVVATWVAIGAAIDSVLDSLAEKIVAALGYKREDVAKIRAVIAKERKGLGQRVEQLAVEAEAEAQPLSELLGDDEEPAPPTAPKKRGRPSKKGGRSAS
jgi:phage terminase Nu1 subunit (DNA packaging protein)